MNTGISPGAQPGMTESFKVATGTTVTKFAAVVKTANAGECDLPTAKNDEALGLAAYGQAEGKMLAVVEGGTYWGVAECTGGGAIAVGDKVIIASAIGDLMKDDTASGAVAYVVGEARTPAAADGDEFIVKITLDNYQVA
jgi:hypothetical protein